MNDQTQPNVDDLIRTELKRLMAQSKEFRDKIESAKTKTKVSVYKKKLKKNNIKLMNIMVALERLKKSTEEPTGEPE